MIDRNLRNRLISEYKQVGTFAGVAENYEVSKALVWKVINIDGYEPKNNAIRERFDLPKIDEFPICHKCDRPMKDDKHACKVKRPPRIAIRLDDPESAARSIKGKMDPGLVRQLVRLLE